MITPDDPRHGTRAGYQAHRKAKEDACEACLRGRAREDKTVRYDHHRGVRMEYTPDEVYALLEPWLAMGLSYGAIGNAAGLGGTHGSRLSERIAERRPFRRVTYQALAAVTEADFHGSATVDADLTKTRIYSLMAAGHTLISMPILATGKWRANRHITVEQSARIRDHYAAHEHTTGPSVHTQNRARRAGHLPPVAWDDPGTLAWPLGSESPLTARECLDEVAVQRILSGDWRQPTNAFERAEVVRRWVTAGRSMNELARLTGWKPERYYRLSDHHGRVAS